MKMRSNVAMLMGMSLLGPLAHPLSAAEGGPAPVRPAAGTTQAEGPKLEFVQMVKYGEEGVAMGKGISSIRFSGDYLYVSADKPAIITWFKRDLQTGTVTYAGNLNFGQRLVEAFPDRKWAYNVPKGPGCILALAGGRLYAVPTTGAWMVWYELDAKTGQPVEKGMVECPGAWQVAVSPNQKDLYVKNCEWVKGPAGKPVQGSLVWFRLESDGKPVRMAEVTGKGLGVGGQIPYFSLLQIAPDGKFLYGASCADNAVAVIERKPAGEIGYRATVDLSPLNVSNAKPGYFSWGSLAITPDGTGFYTGLWGYGHATNNACGIFARDGDTGEVKLREALDGGKLGGVLKGWDVFFLPDGSGGYWGSTFGPAAFKRGPSNGRVEQTATLKELRGHNAQCLALDLEHGFLYAGSRAWDGASGNLFVIRTEKAPAGR
jgi:hypothetical protein